MGSPVHHQQQTRIVGAGLPRTGTTSLAAALEILGFGPVLHGAEGEWQRSLASMPHATHIEITFPPGQDRQEYTKLLHAKVTNPGASGNELCQITGISLSDLTARYTSTLDVPTSEFSAELSSLYPESLVILTVRDSDSAWWKSWDGTWGAYNSDSIKGTLLRILIWPVWEVRDSIRMVSVTVAGWRQRHGCYGPAVHGRYNAEVIDRIPAGRLLVYNVKQSWGPLCRFLGVGVLEVPFPHVRASPFAY
ncbi:sulfotransferase family protein [Aspergillus undulatus]|uniref:sulfotransferase family protein n=1 Tax=Aspergillus undulatus TaxID=1810928 RepID=UPI003CCCD673